MLSITHSAGLIGIEAFSVTVEVNSSRQGLPGWHTVGLAQNAVKESKERVLAAIRNSNYHLQANKIILNLAPADVPKVGSAFDLPIAIGILASDDFQFVKNIEDYLIVGELSLSGQLKPIPGGLSMSKIVQDKNYAGLILPKANYDEAALNSDIQVYPANNLMEVVDFLKDTIELSAPDRKNKVTQQSYSSDFSEVKGQEKAKRALEIAATGFHNVLLVGAPGSGKSMLAKCLSSIMGPLSQDEKITLTKVYSNTKNFRDLSIDQLIEKRPFRSPHHSISNAGLLGGGSPPKPGEVTLAHSGVLFLDEFPEFKKSVLESLRQPLEDAEITIARANFNIVYPSDFLLIAAMNPCPCGNYAYENQYNCSCSYVDIKRYQSKISGPLLDRFDMQISVEPLEFWQLNNSEQEIENSEIIQKRVINAQNKQRKRLESSNKIFNSQMSNSDIEKHCQLENSSTQFLLEAAEEQQFSARSYYRVKKVARTIADLDSSPEIEKKHLEEAINYKVRVFE